MRTRKIPNHCKECGKILNESNHSNYCNNHKHLRPYFKEARRRYARKKRLELKQEEFLRLNN